MKIGMLFPGYGSQYVGMAKELYDELRIVQELFEQASSCLDINFVKLCFASSDSELGKMGNAYPALFLVSSAIAAALKERNINPTVMAGMGVGEYAAIFTANGMALPDGLYLLSKWATMYHDVMSAEIEIVRLMGVDTIVLKKICDEIRAMPEHVIEISGYIKPKVHLLTANQAALDALSTHLDDMKKVKLSHLSPEYGVHCFMADPVVDAWKMYLQKNDFNDLTVPLIRSTDGKLIQKSKDVRESILKLFSMPVQWYKQLQKMKDVDLIVQVGPGIELQTMAKEMHPDILTVAVNALADIDELAASIAAHSM